jgi:hypothetical protein
MALPTWLPENLVLISGTAHTSSTVDLSRTELLTLRLLVLGGIIENQNSDFVTPIKLIEVYGVTKSEF